MCLFKLFRRRKKQDATVAPTVDVREEKQPVEIKSEPAKVEVKSEKVEIKPVKEIKEAKEVVRRKDGKVFVKVSYNRSYTAKLIQGDSLFKYYYGEIKNRLLSYKVKNRISWHYETFKKGRKLLARLAVRGKTLCLYLALNPSEYIDSEYKINDVSAVAKNAEVPLLYKIKNDRRCRYSKDLIDEVMAANGLEAGISPAEDYAAMYPYEEIEPLLERGLVKLIEWKDRGESAESEQGEEEGLIEMPEEKYRQLTAEASATVVESVTVAEAEERIADEDVETFVNISERYSDKTKKDIVNIDALGRYFKAGERVTVEEIRKRVPSVNGKATYIKVLARGTLDKPLNIEADDFSPAAIKMIVLTGGTVTRTK